MNQLSGRFFGRCVLFGLLQILTPVPLGLSDEVKHDVRGPGTLRMAERLQKLAEQVNPMKNRFLSIQRAQLLEPVVAATTDTKRRGDLTFLLASELLNAGQNAQALHLFEGLEQTVKGVDPQAF